MRILKCLMLLCLLLPVSAFCAEQQDNRARLQEIQKRIEETSDSIKAQQRHELSMLRDLAVINTSLKQINRRIQKLKTLTKTVDSKIEKVRDEIGKGRQELRSQERKLKKRLVALYKEGDNGLLKVLFSSDSPMELAEQYEYMSRVLGNDKEIMAGFLAVITRQQTRLTDLKNLQAQQEKYLLDEKSEREDALSARQLQAQLLSKVRLDKSALNAELSKLTEKAKRLKNLVSGLGQASYSGKGRFAALKGKLPWPLKGTLLVGFGKQKNAVLGTLYESHGIEIAALKGKKLQAVASGKVVFANWFKGYGNLLIISHEGNYHTLYAQTDSILKQVGDRVEAGENIAVAGLPGEQGIYFEVRQNGAPVNPMSWLQPK